MLSPEFEEEEAKKKQITDQKAKKDAMRQKQEEQEKTKPKGERIVEGEGFQPRGSTERGRGRGIGRPYRGRGGYSRGTGATDYVPREKPRVPGDYHFAGSSDPIHPFDRKSGTGRGTEIPKRGGGNRNWGRPEDDIKYQEKPAEEEENVGTEEKVLKEGETAQVKQEGKKEEETGQPKYKNKKDKKKGKKNYEMEEKKEESMDPTGTALTFQEYQAKLAEKQKDLPTKKPAETHVTHDPKTIAGLVAYEKPKDAKTVETGKTSKKKTVAQEETEQDKIVLGAFIDPEYRRKEFRTAPVPGAEAPVAPKVEGQVAEQEERPQRGRGTYRGQRRGGYDHPKVEERKAEPAPFVLKEDDFPSLK